MPCYTRVESKVEWLSTSTNVDLLAAALIGMGWNVDKLEDGLRFAKSGRTGFYDARSGRLQADEALDTAELKRGYSKQVVTSTAKRNGWQVKWSVNADGNEVAEVAKRNY